jgi:hypothetical protein
VTGLKAVELGEPVVLGTAIATSLMVEPRFRVGWLRDAPETPQFFIGAVKGVIASLVENEKKLAGMTNEQAFSELAKYFPTPTGAEISAMVPWLLHVAAKATGQPADVIDQLGPVDLVKIVWAVLPSMGALANFQQTPAPGAGTSPASSDGPPLQSTS